MSIRVRSADGKIHQFPDGTAGAVVDRAMLEYASQRKVAEAPSYQMAKDQPVWDPQGVGEGAKGVAKTLANGLVSLPGAVIGAVGRGAALNPALGGLGVDPSWGFADVVQKGLTGRPFDAAGPEQEAAMAGTEAVLGAPSRTVGKLAGPRAQQQFDDMAALGSVVAPVKLIPKGAPKVAASPPGLGRQAAIAVAEKVGNVIGAKLGVPWAGTLVSGISRVLRERGVPPGEAAVQAHKLDAAVKAGELDVDALVSALDAPPHPLANLGQFGDQLDTGAMANAMGAPKASPKPRAKPEPKPKAEPKAKAAPKPKEKTVKSNSQTTAELLDASIKVFEMMKKYGYTREQAIEAMAGMRGPIQKKMKPILGKPPIVARNPPYP